LVTSVDGKRAYFSSDKEGGFGEKDIYVIEFPEFQPRDITVLIGKIINNSGASIADNDIFIINTATSDTLQVLNANSTTGKFGANLPIGETYKIIYRVNGKEFLSELVEAPKGAGYNVVQKDIVYPPGAIAPPISKSTKKDKNEEWFGDKDDDSDTDPKPKTEVNKPAKQVKENKELVKANIPQQTPEDNKAQTHPENEVATTACNFNRLTFDLFFRYNQKDFTTKREEFRVFCDNLKNCIVANQGIVVDIEASASKVPTRRYRTNERLAAARASTAERKIIKALTKRGLKKSEINIVKNELVQGPEYNKDAKENRATYEQFQYIKVKAYIKK